MITIIYGPPRVGKTCLMTYFLNERAFDHERNKEMKREILDRIDGGFSELNIPVYSVACNYEAVFRKFGYSPRPGVKINPYRLGFWNPDVRVHFLPPYTTVGITEAQKYFNSRRFKEYPEWQSRFYEAHGHNHYDFYLDCQRPSLIDVNIRELAEFIEVVEMKYRNGKQVWKIRRIANSALYDVYISSGKQNKKTFKEEKIVSNCDVFSLYDSRNLKPLFYAGHTRSDYDHTFCKVNDGSVGAYVEAMATYLDELPNRFYQKR